MAFRRLGASLALPAFPMGIHKVEADIEEQHRDDEELECDLEGERLRAVERLREGVEDRFNHLDAFVDLAPESIESEPAIEPDGLPGGVVAARICERAFEIGEIENERLKLAAQSLELA
jgi:hypothetical protein